MKSIKTLLIIISPLVGCQTTPSSSEKTDQEQVLDVVKPPLNFQSSAKLHGDLFQTSDVREVLWAHIMFNYHPSDSVMEDEIRWWIYDIWQDNQTSDGIIKCSRGCKSLNCGGNAPKI